MISQPGRTRLPAGEFLLLANLETGSSRLAYAIARICTPSTAPSFLVPARVVKALMVVVAARSGVGGAWARGGMGVCPRTPSLTSVLDTGWLPVGYMMWWGVPADDGAAAQSCWAVPPAGVGRRVAGAGRGSSDDFGLAARQGRGTQAATGSKRLVAEFAQEVVAAFQELARDRDARAVTAEPLGGLPVVLAIFGRERPLGIRSTQLIKRGPPRIAVQTPPGRAPRRRSRSQPSPDSPSPCRTEPAPSDLSPLQHSRSGRRSPLSQRHHPGLG
jgi:hypothetical protein